MEIRVLARQGRGIREIARTLGVSRNTVRRYLKADAVPTYKVRPPRPTKLDPFKAYLLQRVAQARPHWLPAIVLLREIGEQGYRGGISQLKAFLAPHKPARSAQTDALVRFETEPGRQMQAGFVVRLCRPYRAKTKGKVERFNRYLRESFFNPLASRLKGSGLLLDCATANRRVDKWLAEVANVRLHATTQARPIDLWREERNRLTPLPAQICQDWAPLLSGQTRRPLPHESVQHPLSIYDALLEGTT